MLLVYLTILLNYYNRPLPSLPNSQLGPTFKNGIAILRFKSLTNEWAAQQTLRLVEEHSSHNVYYVYNRKPNHFCFPEYTGARSTAWPPGYAPTGTKTETGKRVEASRKRRNIALADAYAVTFNSKGTLWYLDKKGTSTDYLARPFGCWVIARSGLFVLLLK